MSFWEFLTIIPNFFLDIVIKIKDVGEIIIKTTLGS